MITNSVRSDLGLLERYRVALENVELQSRISTVMAEYTYDATAITEGKQLLAKARTAYDANKLEDDETLEAKKQLDSVFGELLANFRKHRKKAQIVLRNNPVLKSQLGIDVSVPKAYLAQMDTMRKFYTNATASEETRQKLLKLKIVPEDLTGALSKIDQVEQLRVAYLRELGESQDATKTKDQAMKEISEWMRDFYDIARIALEDHPQLLEALGLKVRS